MYVKNHLWVFFLLWGLTALGQEHSYAHYDVHDGLAGSTVYSMAQDREGFIWFGTETGVSRFDGTRFVNFTTRDGLPDNEILKVFVDSRDRVWMCPFKHSVCYYYKGKIHNQENDSVLRKAQFNSIIFSIVEDADSNIVLGQNDRLTIIDKRGAVRAVAPHLSRMGVGASIAQIGLNDRRSLRVILAFFGLEYRDVKGDSMVYVKKIERGWFNNYLSMHLYPDLETYVSGDSLMFVRGQATHVIRKPKGFIGMSRINDSSMVLNTYNSTYLLNMHQWNITDSFLSGRTVNSVLEDSEGSLWFSTLGRGVFRLGSAEVNNYFFPVKGENLGIYSIGRSGDYLYFGGDHYFIARLDRRTGGMDHAELDSTTTRGRITALLELNHEQMLAGTDLGIFVFKDPHRPKFVGLPEAIKSITITRDSTLLFSTDKNTQRWDLRVLAPIDTQRYGRTTCSWKMADGSYMLGTVNGLYQLKPPGRVPGVVNWLGDNIPVFARRISAMREDSSGVLWIGTDGDGVVGYRDGRVVQHFTEENGLTSNIIRTIFIAGRAIWAGTDKGLNKIDLSGWEPSITPYSMSDGLSSDEINAVYVEGNKVYVGNSEGLTYFDETKLSKRSRCDLRITGVEVSNRRLPTDSNDLVLTHEDNNIKVDFAGISFRSAGKINYRYRLLGLDSGWKETGAQVLSYPSLPSGGYELQLMAVNKFGIESPLVSVRFSVSMLLRERWWFRILMVAMVALAIFLFFHYRLRLLKRKAEEKTEINKKLAELEQMALRSQMNPHFIFNCLNSIQQYVIYRDVLGANEFITKFSYLIRQTLDLSSRQSISLYEEINYIETYMALEKKRFDDKFIYEIVIAPEVDRSSCYIPPMILQPYIENAVRHGIGLRNDQNGLLLVKMSYEDDVLLCIIEDNGVGRKIARQFKSINSIAYQSVGMSLVAKRIEMINKTSRSLVKIDIEDLEGEGGAPLGTRILIRFPLEIVLN